MAKSRIILEYYDKMHYIHAIYHFFIVLKVAQTENPTITVICMFLLQKSFQNLSFPDQYAFFQFSKYSMSRIIRNYDNDIYFSS